MSFITILSIFRNILSYHTAQIPKFLFIYTVFRLVCKELRTGRVQAADNKRRYAPDKVHPAVLLWGIQRRRSRSYYS